MTQESEDLDRVVSRRVHNPTPATEEETPAYRAADSDSNSQPETDSRTGGEGGAAERAAREVAADDESEPTRSE